MVKVQRVGGNIFQWLFSSKDRTVPKTVPNIPYVHQYGDFSRYDRFTDIVFGDASHVQPVVVSIFFFTLF